MKIQAGRAYPLRNGEMGHPQFRLENGLSEYPWVGYVVSGKHQYLCQWNDIGRCASKSCDVVPRREYKWVNVYNTCSLGHPHPTLETAIKECNTSSATDRLMFTFEEREDRMYELVDVTRIGLGPYKEN